jgi:hypothetical protein
MTTLLPAATMAAPAIAMTLIAPAPAATVIGTMNRRQCA